MLTRHPRHESKSSIHYPNLKGEHDVTQLKWDRLISRLQTRMSKGYCMQFPGEDTVRVNKGKLEPIQILVQSRGGRKTITCVRNLEAFRQENKRTFRGHRKNVVCRST